MQRRALLGLGLFLCLLASGWAWQRFVQPEPMGQGAYVRITTPEADRPGLCNSTAETAPPGILRVRPRSVSIHSGACTIMFVRQHAEDTTEGVSVTEEIGLDCGAEGAGPEGLDATLWLTHRAEVTTYVAGGDEGYIPAHASFQSCAQWQ